MFLSFFLLSKPEFEIFCGFLNFFEGVKKYTLEYFASRKFRVFMQIPSQVSFRLKYDLLWRHKLGCAPREFKKQLHINTYYTRHVLIPGAKVTLMWSKY